MHGFKKHKNIVSVPDHELTDDRNIFVVDNSVAEYVYAWVMYSLYAYLN